MSKHVFNTNASPFVPGRNNSMSDAPGTENLLLSLKKTYCVSRGTQSAITMDMLHQFDALPIECSGETKTEDDLVFTQKWTLNSLIGLNDAANETPDDVVTPKMAQKESAKMVEKEEETKPEDEDLEIVAKPENKIPETIAGLKDVVNGIPKAMATSKMAQEVPSKPVEKAPQAVTEPVKKAPEIAAVPEKDQESSGNPAEKSPTTMVMPGKNAVEKAKETSTMPMKKAPEDIASSKAVQQSSVKPGNTSPKGAPKESTKPVEKTQAVAVLEEASKTVAKVGKDAPKVIVKPEKVPKSSVKQAKKNVLVGNDDILMDPADGTMAKPNVVVDKHDQSDNRVRIVENGVSGQPRVKPQSKIAGLAYNEEEFPSLQSSAPLQKVVVKSFPPRKTQMESVQLTKPDVKKQKELKGTAKKVGKLFPSTSGPAQGEKSNKSMAPRKIVLNGVLTDRTPTPKPSGTLPVPSFNASVFPPLSRGSSSSRRDPFVPAVLASSKAQTTAEVTGRVVSVSPTTHGNNPAPARVLPTSPGMQPTIRSARAFGTTSPVRPPALVPLNAVGTVGSTELVVPVSPAPRHTSGINSTSATTLPTQTEAQPTVRALSAATTSAKKNTKKGEKQCMENEELHKRMEQPNPALAPTLPTSPELHEAIPSAPAASTTAVVFPALLVASTAAVSIESTAPVVPDAPITPATDSAAATIIPMSPSMQPTISSALASSTTSPVGPVVPVSSNATAPIEATGAVVPDALITPATNPAAAPTIPISPAIQPTISSTPAASTTSPVDPAVLLSSNDTAAIEATGAVVPDAPITAATDPAAATIIPMSSSMQPTISSAPAASTTSPVDPVVPVSSNATAAIEATGAVVPDAPITPAINPAAAPTIPLSPAMQPTISSAPAASTTSPVDATVLRSSNSTAPIEVTGAVVPDAPITPATDPAAATIIPMSRSMQPAISSTPAASTTSPVGPVVLVSSNAAVVIGATEPAVLDASTTPATNPTSTPTLPISPAMQLTIFSAPTASTTSPVGPVALVSLNASPTVEATGPVAPAAQDTPVANPTSAPTLPEALPTVQAPSTGSASAKNKKKKEQKKRMKEKQRREKEQLERLKAPLLVKIEDQAEPNRAQEKNNIAQENKNDQKKESVAEDPKASQQQIMSRVGFLQREQADKMAPEEKRRLVDHNIGRMGELLRQIANNGDIWMNAYVPLKKKERSYLTTRRDKDMKKFLYSRLVIYEKMGTHKSSFIAAAYSAFIKTYTKEFGPTFESLSRLDLPKIIHGSFLTLDQMEKVGIEMNFVYDCFPEHRAQYEH